MGRAGTEPKLGEFRAFCAVLNGAAQGSIGCLEARWQSCLWARPACSPFPGAAAFLQALVALPLPLASFPPGPAFWDGSRSQPCLSQLQS